MTDVDASQVGGTVGASQPGGTVGARLAKPQADLWTPAQLGDDLALWLDWKDSPFDLRTDGGTDYVTSWGDLSGNGNDATQSAGSQQPVLDGGVVFDGGFLSGPKTAFSYNGDFQWHVVVQQVNPSRSQPFGLDDTSSQDFIGFGPKEGGDVAKYYTSGETGTDGPAVSDGSHIYTSVWREYNNTFTARVDGEDYLFETPTGSGWQKSTEPFVNGPLDNSQMTVYAAVLIQGADGKLKAEGWAAHKFGLEGNLDENHPHKDEWPRV